jgi:hypothetical protein
VFDYDWLVADVTLIPCITTHNKASNRVTLRCHVTAKQANRTRENVAPRCCVCYGLQSIFVERRALQ